MTPSEIKQMITGVGVPSAYYQFPSNTGQQPPFICYFFDLSNDFKADNTNYVRVERLNIELYTDTKDFALEKALETILNNNELVFTKEEVFLDDESMHETIYTTEVLLEV